MTRVDDAAVDSGDHVRVGWLPVVVAGAVTAALVAGAAATWQGAAPGQVGPGAAPSASTGVAVPDPRPGTLPRPDG